MRLESRHNSMLGDPDPSVRAEAVALISAARQRRQLQSEHAREFRPPSVNFRATSFTDMVDLRRQEYDVEPPYVRSLSSEELAQLVASPLKTKVPNHTQSTERAVKLTTESVSAVSGSRRQDGLSLNKVAFTRRFK